MNYTYKQKKGSKRLNKIGKVNITKYMECQCIWGIIDLWTEE